MPKILSQAGISLADSYDIEGSIVGVDNLDANNVALVHEMGATIQSERLETHVIQINSGVLEADDTFDIDITTIPDSINRILGIYVTVDVTARMDFCSVALRPRDLTADAFPLWSWDTDTDIEVDIRIMQGGTTANRLMLVPTEKAQYAFQVIMTRGGLGLAIPFISFSGVAKGFGAGELNAAAHVLLCRPDAVTPAAGEPSSHGLPIPSW